MSNSIENLKFGDQVARDIETILFESPDKNVAELISKNTQRSIQNFGKYTEESLKDLRKIYTDAGNEIQHIVVDRGIRRGKGMPISVDETVRLGLIKKDIEHQISIVDGKLNNFVPGAVREAGSKGELMGAGELETLTKEIPRIGFPNFTMINKEAVEFSANYALETSIDYGHEALGAIKRRLDLAVVEGKAWGPVSREVRKIIIERSGQPLTGAHFKANRIVRTELARSFSSGHSAYGRACSFVIGETWHVTGGNVCSECLALDGKEYVYSKKESPPGPPLHPHCYTWDTEVYTDKGWKLFRKLTLKEKVYSIDPNSLKREYLPIINFVRYKFKGKMIHFNSRWIDLSVTPDHRMIYFNKGVQDDMDANSFSPVKGYLFVGKNGTVRNDFKKTRAFYNGYVYDIEVPKWHIILVRRGIRKSDRGVWSSNCRCYTEYTYSKNLFTKEEIERLKPEVKVVSRGHLLGIEGKEKAINQILKDAKMANIKMDKPRAERIYDAINGYTKQDYAQIRHYQQTGEFIGKGGTKLDPDIPFDWPYINAIKNGDRGIEKIIKISPNFKGQTFRGISKVDSGNLWGSLVKKGKRGFVVDMRGTSSWSSNEKSAKYFGDIIFYTPENQIVKKSTSIAHISSEVENELIISKMAKFRLLKRPEIKVIKGEKYLYVPVEVI